MTDFVRRFVWAGFVAVSRTPLFFLIFETRQGLNPKSEVGRTKMVVDDMSSWRASAKPNSKPISFLATRLFNQVVSAGLALTANAIMVLS
jgi:hypothetical protein